MGAFNPYLLMQTRHTYRHKKMEKYAVRCNPPLPPQSIHAAPDSSIQFCFATEAQPGWSIWLINALLECNPIIFLSGTNITFLPPLWLGGKVSKPWFTAGCGKTPVFMCLYKGLCLKINMNTLSVFAWGQHGAWCVFGSTFQFASSVFSTICICFLCSSSYFKCLSFMDAFLQK